MNTPSVNGFGGQTARPEPQTAESAALLDVQAVAKLLDCSPRHVYRLSDAGRMPRPVKLGQLVRWRRAELHEWIAEGCPSCSERGVRP
jgi:excisionase family DNA binding protein